MASAEDILQTQMNRVMPADDARDHVRTWRAQIGRVLSQLDAEQQRQLTVAQYPSSLMVAEELDAELGFSLSTLRSNIHTVMNAYTQSLERLCMYNQYIHTHTTRIAALHTALLNVLLLETSETAALQTSIDAYIRSCYAACDIEAAYVHFIREYARFQHFRNVLVSTHACATSATSPPQCTVCMQQAVSYALNCGHVYCASCAQQQHTHCFVCRTPAERRTQLYF
jgi:hypothetical protein